MSTPGQGSILGSPIIYAKVDYGPTFGQVYRPVNQKRVVTAAGTDTVQPFDQLVIYKKTVPAAFQVILPDLNLWMTQPYGGLDLTFIDGSGNAATYPITFVPFGSQKIEGVASNFDLDTNGGALVFVPAVDKLGWTLIEALPGSGGGSGTPDPPDTSVQFNDGGAFGGQADFTFNKSNGLVTLPSLEVTTGVVLTPEGAATGAGVDFAVTAGDGGVTSGNGGNVYLQSGSADGAGYGGAIHILAGDAEGNTSQQGGTVYIAGGGGPENGDGGDISVTGGNGGRTNGTGGTISLLAGYANDSDGGEILIESGGGGGSGWNGGQVKITGGQADIDGNGAPILLTAGAGGSTSGNGGDITLTPGTKTLGTLGHVKVVTLQNFATDAAALSGGVPVNGLYRTEFVVKVNVGSATEPYQAFDAQLSSLIRQNSKSVNYTTVLTDGGKHILHPTADNNARDFTIDSNANVAYPIGTAITFVNQINTITIKITSDTMTLASTGTTGNRTLAAKSIATALKIGTTDWIISGSGLT